MLPFTAVRVLPALASQENPCLLMSMPGGLIMPSSSCGAISDLYLLLLVSPGKSSSLVGGRWDWECSYSQFDLRVGHDFFHFLTTLDKMAVAPLPLAYSLSLPLESQSEDNIHGPDIWSRRWKPLQWWCKKSRHQNSMMVFYKHSLRFKYEYALVMMSPLLFSLSVNVLMT